MSKRNRKPNRKKKNKTGNIISTIILIIAVCVFVVAAYQLLLNVLPYYQGGKDYDKVKALAVQTDGTDDKDAKTSGEEQVGNSPPNCLKMYIVPYYISVCTENHIRYACLNISG